MLIYFVLENGLLELLVCDDNHIFVLHSMCAFFKVMQEGDGREKRRAPVE